MKREETITQTQAYRGNLHVRVAVVCVAVAICAILCRAVFARDVALDRARYYTCISNLKQCELGVLMYTQDYDDRMPISTRWMTDIYPYTKNAHVLQCPVVAAAGGDNKFGYAMDSRLSGKPISLLVSPAENALLFESSTLTKNATDACKSIPVPTRHGTMGDVIGFGDGHVKGFAPARIKAEIASFAANPIARPSTKKKK